MRLSDDEVLAEIYLLGEKASNAELGKTLDRRTGAHLEHDDVDRRLRQLQSAGLVTYAPVLNAALPLSAVRPVRLSAHGVERLCAGQHKSVAPETG